MRILIVFIFVSISISANQMKVNVLEEVNVQVIAILN